MLRKLSIKNFVLIEEVKILFSPGMIILSGETGGGKSVIASAIALFAGGRARSDHVRKGFEKALIEGEFEAEGGKGLLVRREIDRAGRSRCWIDGSPAGAGRLKEELGKLLCVTSQHEQVSLADPVVQRQLLDEFGGLERDLEIYVKIFRESRQAKEELFRLRGLAAEREGRMDYLEHRIKEIGRAALKPGEDDQIRSRLSAIKNHGRITGVMRMVFSDLVEGEESAASRIGRVAREVEKTASIMPEAAEIGRILADAGGLLGEVGRIAGSAMEKIDFDEGAVDSLHERLFEIERLKKKYGGGIESILLGAARMEEELANLTNLEGSIDEIEKKAVKLERELVSAAGNISRMRKKAGKRLRMAVLKELGEIGFGSMDFDVEVKSRFEEIAGRDGGDDPGAWLDDSGGDEVDLLIRPNEGEDFAPLRRIASGGELSKVLLALKVALKSGGRGETFIFDEVDAGLGGAGADAVGRKLQMLGKYNQVLCITHLPQIAAYGDKHILVGKRTAGGRTTTYIEELEEGGRVEELARMIGGEKITPRGREVAREMLSIAERFKCR